LLINEELGKQELYNINSDWGEQKNLIDSNPEKVQKLLLKLKQWEKSLPTEPASDCFSAERKTIK
jgi:hypothetical protein